MKSKIYNSCCKHPRFGAPRTPPSFSSMGHAQFPISSPATGLVHFYFWYEVSCIHLASGKEPTCQCRKHNDILVPSLGQKDPLEEGTATHSSILAWRIPWTAIVHRVTLRVRIQLNGLSMHA